MKNGKPLLLVTSALLLASLPAVSAQQAPDVPQLPCIDVSNGGTLEDYSWTGPGSTLRFVVRFDVPTCTDATYTQWVRLDSGLFGDVPGQEGQLTSLSLPGDGESTSLVYDVPIDDNDGTLCVWTVTEGTTTTSNEADGNGNGNTVDDQHQQNEGNNKDGTKHDWATTTQRYSDRAPNTGCLEVYTVAPPDDGAPGQNYN